VKPKKAIKEYEKSLKKDPDNINIRIKLASALREVGRQQDSARMYLSVARAYHDRGRLAQAIAVCKSALEVVPGDSETTSYLEELNKEFQPPPEEAPPPLPPPKAKPTSDFKDEDSDVRDASELTQSAIMAPPVVAEGTKPGIGIAELVDGDATLADALAGKASGVVSARLPQAMAKMASAMKLRQFSSGDFVVREGDPGTAVFLIVSGRVRILKRKPGGGGTEDFIEIAQLGEGAIFGEFAVLADLRRHATVQVLDGACHIYEIDRKSLLALFETYPELAAHLRSFFNERLQNTLLATSPFFANIPEDAHQALLEKFKNRHFDKGQEVLVEGQTVDGLYVVLLGSLDVARGGKVIATLEEGSHVGATALVRGEPASSTVVARGPCEVAFLGAEDFYEVVSANPVLWEQVWLETKKREEALDAVG
jgi:CRP-like cAMP-binding protein